MPAYPRPRHDPEIGLSDPMAPVRYLDLLLVAMALPFVLIASLPLLGYAVGAASWTLQRVAAVAIERRASASSDVRRQLGLNLASMLGRAWIVGLAILTVGIVGEREDGLTAAVLVLAAFTVYFAMSLVLRPLEKGRS
ncbi:MAG TPA: hypothetical protein VES79_02130 [Solirubrobacteraceae bacterium]|nr:hypothetical protein [Solirubrobacteraceae bacterium]